MIVEIAQLTNRPGSEQQFETVEHFQSITGAG